MSRNRDSIVNLYLKTVDSFKMPINDHCINLCYYEKKKTLVNEASLLFSMWYLHMVINGLDWFFGNKCSFLYSSFSFPTASVCSNMALSENASESGSTPELTNMKGLPPNFFIGVSLVMGFTLMFVVDQIGSYCSIHGKPPQVTNKWLIIQKVTPFWFLTCSMHFFSLTCCPCVIHFYLCLHFPWTDLCMNFLLLIFF